jgi:membrane-bound ClpP family serine protease
MQTLAKLIRDYEWVHLTLGVTGNALFVVGSVFFLFEALMTAGTWLFIFGSALMLVGATCNALIKIVRIEGDGALERAAEQAARRVA